jgi:hypothetical protein
MGEGLALALDRWGPPAPSSISRAESLFEKKLRPRLPDSNSETPPWLPEPRIEPCTVALIE